MHRPVKNVQAPDTDGEEANRKIEEERRCTANELNDKRIEVMTSMLPLLIEAKTSSSFLNSDQLHVFFDELGRYLPLLDEFLVGKYVIFAFIL